MGLRGKQMGGQRGNLGQRKEGPQTMDGNDLRNPGAGVGVEGGGGWTSASGRKACKPTAHIHRPGVTGKGW